MNLKYRRRAHCLRIRNPTYPIKVCIDLRRSSCYDFSFALVYDELASRQAILKQMLIDTAHIDHLRVNFVSHFNTENNLVTASHEISEIIDQYPKAMTSQLRQWFNEQQKHRLTAPLATVDASKSIDDFNEYLREIEDNLREVEQNEHNELKLKVRVCIDQHATEERHHRLVLF